MFGSYLHQEGEDDSVSNSEFSLSAYAAQTKHHKRKLRSKPAAVSGMMPVRMGAGGSVKKAAPTPTRRLADCMHHWHCGTDSFPLCSPFLHRHR